MHPETEYFISKERESTLSCSKWLKGDGWRCIQTDCSFDPEIPKGKRRASHCSIAGMADCLYLRYDPVYWARAEAIWIEWKRFGGRPDPHQVDWHHRERKLHAVTLIAGIDFIATFEGFKVWYRQSGLMRKSL